MLWLNIFFCDARLYSSMIWSTKCTTIEFVQLLFPGKTMLWSPALPLCSLRSKWRRWPLTPTLGWWRFPSNIEKTTQKITGNPPKTLQLTPTLGWWRFPSITEKITLKISRNRPKNYVWHPPQGGEGVRESPKKSILRWARGTGWTWPGRWWGRARGPQPSSPARFSTAISMVFIFLKNTLMAETFLMLMLAGECMVEAKDGKVLRMRCGRFIGFSQIAAQVAKYIFWQYLANQCVPHQLNLSQVFLSPFRCDCHRPVGDSASTRWND